MKKNKKRNELSVFEEFRLKPDDFRDKPPKKNKLLIINDIYFYYNAKLKKNTYWILTEPKYTQVTEYREQLDEYDEDYQSNIPKKSSLKEYKTDAKIHVEEEGEDGDYCTWWKENENGELIQVNKTKEEDAGVQFKIKSWLRNKAIDAVGLEIRNMNKKAYEYSKGKLEKMIKEEEMKIMKKKGLFGLRATAAILGFGYLPFL